MPRYRTHLYGQGVQRYLAPTADSRNTWIGDIIAGPVYDESAVLIADLDLGDPVRGKFEFDVTGRYARPDVFTLRVHTAARHAVLTTDARRDAPHNAPHNAPHDAPRA